LQFQNHDTWLPSHFSPSYGQNINSPGLATLTPFHESSAAPYLHTNEQIEIPSLDLSLHLTISDGTEEEIANLLSSGISVSTRDTLNNSPLHTAILRGNISVVKSLLDYGANVDAIGFKGKTPLHLAVASKGMVQLLLKHQPTLSLQDDDGNTILHYMLLIKGWWDDLDVRATMKKLLSAGVDVNIPNKSGESSLHRIVADVIPASQGYMEMVSEFLNYKPDVLSPMRNGLALLAVFLDNTDILLKDTKSDAPDRVRTGFRCLKQLLAAGADPNITFHSKPLISYYLENGAIREQGPSEKFIMLLIQKIDIDTAEYGGNYLLHQFLSMTRLIYADFPVCGIVAALIARGANVNQINAAGASPLEIWLTFKPLRLYGFQNHVLMVALLVVKAGAVTTIFTSTGKTLFDLLTDLPKGDRFSLTKAFLEADINSQQDDSDVAARPDWVEAWRSAWKQPIWRLAKAGLTELEQSQSRPKSKEFTECALLIIVERLLQRHKSQLMVWQKGGLDKESVKENYAEYCAILRDCRERKASIDVSWYEYLLDLMDFK
jgi:ankyrin repeat protein